MNKNRLQLKDDHYNATLLINIHTLYDGRMDRKYKTNSNMKTAMKVCNALECGGTIINGASFFRSFEMPFGGYKYSGIGTEGVMSTFDEVTHTKTIVLKNII